jgi:hypothetical protein
MDQGSEVKSKILSETESLKLEIMNLNNQIIALKKDLLDTQEALVVSQREVLAANEANQMTARANLLKTIGMDKKGRVKFSKTQDGRYEATFEPINET